VNAPRGDILQREAERDRAYLDLRQTEVTVQQDVRSAVSRLEAAQARAELYRLRILPDLRKAIEDMQALFEAAAPGVDILRVIDVQRKYLGALSTYLDALFTVHQARADLVEAVGDPALPGLHPCAPAAPRARGGVAACAPAAPGAGVEVLPLPAESKPPPEPPR